MSRLHSGEWGEMWVQLKLAVEHFFRQAASVDTEKSEQEEGSWAAVPTSMFPPWQIALERGRNDFRPGF